MKLNFWQWLGVILLVVGAIMYYTRKKNDARTVPAPGGPATMPSITTQPHAS